MILAGDPFQLGPVVQSIQGKFLGLQSNMIERLMEFQLYKRDSNRNYNEKFVVQLTKNYRSHPALIKIPNQLFYSNSLQACASDAIISTSGKITQKLCDLNLLPKQGFPIVFHSVHGKHYCPKDSTSLLNPDEVKVVLKYVSKILECKHVTKSDIGIVTPYKQQEKLIRKRLVVRGLTSNNTSIKSRNGKAKSGIEIGSVEKYQGNEKKVMIFSTVKSKKNSNELGFVADAKRFNVAITRAQCLMIIIGDERILKTDGNWNTLIQYVKSKGGFKQF